MASDPKYVAWVRKQACCVTGQPGPSHAHHSTMAPSYAPDEVPSKAIRGARRGRGEKAADYYAIPMSLKTHRQFHDLTGPFEGWDKEQLRAWQDGQVAIHRARYESETAGDAPTVAAARVVKQVGFDIAAETEEFCRIYQPQGGQMRLELKRLLRRVAEEAERGRVF